MLKRYPTLFVLLFCTLTIFPQTPEPTSTPVSDEDIVKISTNLIQVDVTVTDKKGNPITDLKSNEIEIYQNGKKQEITNFSFVANRSQIIEKGSDEKEDITAILPPKQLQQNQVRRTIALVVDDLTLSFESTYQVRRALKKFVDAQMQDGDLVAIIRTGAGIGALQQFTTDKRQLYQAIERVRWNSSGLGNIGAFSPLQAKPEEGALSEALKGDKEAENDEDEKDLNDDLNDFRKNLFSTGTLGALNYVVRGMQQLPGRKSVMFFSDGFEILKKDSQGFIDSSVMNSLRKLIDTANRASVVVYTLDARGLVTTAITAADDTSGRSSQQIAEEVSNRGKLLFDTQEGLIFLSKETGGFAVVNNNSLSNGIEKILKDQSYYLIGYEPDDETFDAEKLKFNKLDIKIKRDGVSVRYRSGFFGMSDEDIKMPTQDLTPIERINEALTSPFAVNDIKLTLNTLFRSNEKKELFLNSFLYINLKDLKFNDEADGNKKAAFDILAVSFGDNGIPTDSVSKTYSINLKNDDYIKLVEQGIIYTFGFPVKKPGAYQMRVALRDHNTNKVGSANLFVVVPKINKKRLTLSGVALKNISYQEWNRGKKTDEDTIDERQGAEIEKRNPMATTSLRQFQRGSVLQYGFEIYNAKYKSGQTPQLELQSRIFRDGKLIFEGKPTPINTPQQAKYSTISAGGAMNLGTDMQYGDYILQLIVTDKLAKEKYSIANEFIQFEIVDQ